MILLLLLLLLLLLVILIIIKVLKAVATSLLEGPDSVVDPTAQ